VDNAAHTAPASDLQPRFAALPWDALEDTPSALRTRYLDHTLTFDVLTFTCPGGRCQGLTI